MNFGMKLIRMNLGMKFIFHMWLGIHKYIYLIKSNHMAMMLIIWVWVGFHRNNQFQGRFPNF